MGANRPSTRPYPSIFPAITYPSHLTVKEVTPAGTFRPGPQLDLLSNGLGPYPVVLDEVDYGVRSVSYCHLLLARIDLRTSTLTLG